MHVFCNLDLAFAAAVLLAPLAPQDAAPPSAPPAKDGGTDLRSDAKPGPVRRVSTMVHANVTDVAGAKLAELKDIIFDDGASCAALAILAPGDGRLMAIPFHALKNGADDASFIFDYPKAELAKAPSFDDHSWPTFDRAYAAKMHDYYKTKTYWDDAAATGAVAKDDAKGGDSEKAKSDDAKGGDKVAHAKEHMPPTTFCRATQTLGGILRDPAEKKLGSIEEIVVDAASGHAAYVVVSVGGLLGAGEKLVPIPWGALQPSAVKGSPLLLDATSDMVEKAPAFDPKQWPDWTDRRFSADVHRYWNQVPYWNADADARGGPRHR